MTAQRALFALGLVLTCASAVQAGQEFPRAPIAASPDAGARLIFGQTARPLAQGQSYFVSHALFMAPVVRTGLTSRISLALGAPAWSTALIAPKFQLLASERIAVAAGVEYVLMPMAKHQKHAAYAYVVATMGRPDAAITLGLGQPFAGERGPLLVTIGGEKRLSPRVIWLTENYVTRGGLMSSGGFRIHGPKKFVEFVMAWMITRDFIAPLPVMNFGWRF